MSLDDIAKKYGTDKRSHYHNYTKYYEIILGPLKAQPIKLLEVGVHKGASLRMWKEYFQNATIYGIDEGEYCKELEEERITVFIGSQENTTFLLDTMKQTEELDVIIDDGSHLSYHQILTFTLLFPYVRPGGWYIIEDLYTSYLQKYNLGANITGLNFCKELIDDMNMNGKNTSIPSKHQRVTELEAKGIELNYFEKNIEYIFFFPGLCMIKKLNA